MSASKYGEYKEAKSHLVLRGTDIPVMSQQMPSIGRTRTGAVQVSGSGAAPTPGNMQRLHTGGEPFFSERTGEINASSKADLIDKIDLLFSGVNSGGADALFERTAKVDAADAERRRDLDMRCAEIKESPEAFAIFAAEMGNTVYETMGRQGFSHQLMQVDDIEEGQIGRIRIRRKDVSAVVSTTNINVNRVFAFQKWVYPLEYIILGAVRFELLELAQSGSYLIDDKYIDLLEQHLVAEDKQWVSQADETIGLTNPLITYNVFTPSVVSTAKLSIDDQGLQCVRAVIAHDIWHDIRTEPEFATYFDPVKKHELIAEGKLGSFYGVQLLTDGLRYPQLRVLNDGDAYFCGQKAAVGVLQQRRGIQVEQTNGFNEGKPWRGLFSWQAQSMTVRSHGVAVAKRA